MENSEVIEEIESFSQIYFSEINDENDQYDENEDDYDINEEDIYDDGIANSNIDDTYDEVFDEDPEDFDSETVSACEADPSMHKELEDSLQESEDYDELDD